MAATPTVSQSAVKLTRKVIVRESTGTELLSALKREKLAGGISFVPRKLEQGEWKRCKEVVVSLTKLSSDDQRFCVAYFDRHTVVRKFVGPSTVFPSGTVVYAAQG